MLAICCSPYRVLLRWKTFADHASSGFEKHPIFAMYRRFISTTRAPSSSNRRRCF
jgi:hypothetical protein